MRKNVRQRLLALLLACVMVLGLCPTALAADPAEHVIINQVYGGSNDGYASHSFIELYNPTGEAVDLSGWSVQYRSSADGDQSDAWVKLDLTGSIGAADFYLIRCDEVTTADNVNYQVPAGNQEWDIQLHNKGLSVALVDDQDPLDTSVTGEVSANADIIDLAACAGNDYTPPPAESNADQLPPAWQGENPAGAKGIQSKKKAIRRVDFKDTDALSDFELVDYSKAVPEDKQPHVGKTDEDEGEPETFATDSLTLQPGETQSSINLNWYAPAGTDAACVKFGDVVVAAVVSELHEPTVVNGDKYTDTGKRSCKATVSGLEANTKYTYQVSNDGGATWSQTYTYTTPAEDSFTFAFTSDPQIREDQTTDDKGWNSSDGTNQTGWAKMMEVLGKTDATLVVSAGDQVEDQSWGKTSEYDAFFAPEEMTSMAYAPAVGNHDRHYMFANHFNLPNEMQGLEQVKTTFRGQNSGTSQSHGNYIKATENESNSNSDSNGVTPNDEGYYDFAERREMETRGNYYYLYNNVLFITLNTGAYPGGNDDEGGTESGQAENDEAEAIVENFRMTIKAAKTDYAGEYDWIVVTHHKSTQTVAKHAADSDIENYVDAGFEALMADEGVDFVLGGHDHVYSRSYVLDENGERASERLDTINDPDGVIYLTGNCCSDMQYYTPFSTLDKMNNGDYPVLANGETGSAAYLKGQDVTGAEQAGYLPIGNQEWNQEYSPSYVLFTVEGDTITAKAYNLAGDSDSPSSKEIDSFTVTKGADGGEKSQGFRNGRAALDVTQVGRYDSGMTDADGGVMEIVDYNASTGWAYAVNGKTGMMTAIPLDAEKSALTVGDTVDLLDGYNIDVKALVEDSTFSYGDMTSVAVSPNGKTLAAAIQAKDYTANGRVALFTCHADGTLTFRQTVETGVQPDMVTFTPDGSKILTANEGEPREGYSAPGAVDPAGSVTIIDAKSFVSNTVGFEAFDGTDARAALVNKGVVLKKNTAPSVDLEPEYIACTDDTAYVSLQEANAIAVLNLRGEAPSFTGVWSVGFEDHSRIAVDINKEDEKYNARTYGSLRGIRMPDGISVYQVNGATYLLTANEGDSRAWPVDTETDINEIKDKTSPNGKKFEKKVTWFDASQYDDLEAGVDYIFGGRSFTMLKVTDTGLEEVFDSKNDFEAKTAAYLPDYFNCSNDDLTIDDRSGKKGPEPETVVTGEVGGRTYAFITLERIGGVMVYDITNPEKVSYVNYINSRDFSKAVAADDSPEGLKFISAANSPTGEALLLAACEVGGTVAAYELTAGNPSPEADGLKIAVISDDHLYKADVLGKDGEAFEEYLASDRKLLVESEAILDAALEKIAKSGAEYLLIPGDLTKDGEKVNHELLAEKLKAFEKRTRIQVFVINGNHDVSNENALSFAGETPTPVDTVYADEFREIYKEFGYGQAVAKDPNSLSYAADLGTDYRLIAMDACTYNDKKDGPGHKTGGKFEAPTLAWVLEQIKDAVQDGRRPVGMMHHGLVPHTAVQPLMFSEYLVAGYETVAAKLADAGMNVVFTGHFHSQDVASVTTKKGNTLYDVETGSLVTSPCPIRYVTLGEDSFRYTTEHVTEVKGIENFEEHAATFLQQGMEELVTAKLPGILIQYGMAASAEEAKEEAAQLANQPLVEGITVKSLLAGAFAAHYAGDEQMSELVQTIVAVLKSQGSTDARYKLLADTVEGLYKDAAPADCTADALKLPSLPVDPDDDGPSGGDSSGGDSSGGDSSGGDSSGGGSSNSSSSGSGSSSTTTTTEKNPDGSTTTTTTDKATGTVTETVQTASGVTGTTVTDRNGKVTEIKASIPAAAAAQAAKSGETVKLPVEVPAARSTEDAPAVAVTVPRSASGVKVEIPVKRVSSGAVAVIVRADGTEELVKTSVITGDGVALKLDGSATVKVVDNARNFADTNGHWAEDAIDFVTAREMFAGTTATTFTPNSHMTRAQLMTVLARFDGEDTTGGSVWYEKGMEWAKRNGVSDGSNPGGSITREQLAAMLYRYAGSPAVGGSLGRFSDAGKVTGYASNAMGWAVETGLISGMGNGTLNPQGNATRAQLATILMRYCENLMK